MRKYLGVGLFVGFLLAGCGSPAPPDEAPAEVGAVAEPEPESNRGTVELTVGATSVSVNYGRPELQGRDMISQLPDGQVWRLGMNDATMLETSGPLVFGETTIEAGRYSLWARKVSAKEWNLIFNSEADIWGTARKAENDLFEVPLQVSDSGEAVEQFTIESRPTDEGGAELVMAWGTLELIASFAEGTTDEQ